MSEINEEPRGEGRQGEGGYNGKIKWGMLCEEREGVEKGRQVKIEMLQNNEH